MNAIFLPTTALLLGIRHGMDWDHVAAIMDIVSASPAPSSTKAVPPSLAATAILRQWSGFRSRSVKLACYYAVGHAAVVIILGVVAIAFSLVLPAWVEPVMQRIVGATLLLFALCILRSLWQSSQGKQKFRMRSRWMLVIDAVKIATVRAKLQDCDHERPEPGCCGPRSAFAMGLIHGIGAETGTQILLLTTLSGSSGSESGVGMILLFSFVIGMFLSNTIIAFLASAGVTTSKMAMPLTVGVGLLTAGFSLWLGTLMMLGHDMPAPVLFWIEQNDN